MVEYGFEEGIDFVMVAQKRATNNLKNPVTTVIDHAISIDMAKEISMIQRTEKGKQARLYFIECEKIAKNMDNVDFEILWMGQPSGLWGRFLSSIRIGTRRSII